MRETNLFCDLSKARRMEASGLGEVEEDGILTALRSESFRAHAKLGNAHYQRQSAFMRTSHQGPLTDASQTFIRTSMIRLLIAAEKRGALQRLRFNEGDFRLQGWGVRATFDALTDLIVPSGMSDLKVALDAYVDKVIILANVQGRSQNLASDCQAVWHSITNSPNFTAVPNAGSDPTTILDISLQVDEPGLSDRNRAELFTLLTLSLVGFTGIALEWCLLESFVPRRRKLPWAYRSEPWQIVSEALRLRPSAWKLVRDEFVNPATGKFHESLMMMIHTVHLSERHWDQPDQFNPLRWAAKDIPVDGFLPFGSHKMICPARQFAFNYLEAGVTTLASDFLVHTPRIRRRPYVGILYAPARQKIRLRRVTHAHE